MFDHNLKVVDVAQKEFRQIAPKVGWVEHDPEEIWATVKDCLTEVCDRNSLTPQTVKAVGITNQRETTVPFSRSKGTPYHNALVWLD